MDVFPAKILLATDGSEDSALAAQAAIKTANDSGAELHVVHVGESMPAYPPPTTSGPPPAMPSREEIRRAAQGLLDHQVEAITQSGGKIAEAHLRMGRPAEEILRLSEDIVAGLIVVGNQGLSGRFSRMRRFLMGGVSESVTRYARCSVMVVRSDLYDRPST
ncbi:MAG: universal stress protein [Actinomycetota bacterium]|nr:universal stress protein [Actinomycetota bacterium]